jgi:hypothetical protein
MPVLMSRTLKTTVLVDAVVTGAAAALMMLGAPLLAGPLGLPHNLLFMSGAVLVPFVALLVFLAGASRVSRLLMFVIIGINLAWVAASLFVAFGPVFAPTLLGKVFVCAQAAAVLAFAEFQMLGLKRSAAAT